MGTGRGGHLLKPAFSVEGILAGGLEEPQDAAGRYTLPCLPPHPIQLDH